MGPTDEARWGHIRQIVIRRSARFPYLLTAFIDLGISCGNDGSVYVFERRSKTWELVLVYEANDYDQVNGAHGSLLYVLGATSPADWFLVTMTTRPWCTSVWEGLDYTVLRKGPGPRQPRAIFRRHELVETAETDIKLGGDGKEFTVEFTTSHEEGNWRRVKRTYSVTGNLVRRRPARP